jgi:hypothetical protein
MIGRHKLAVAIFLVVFVGLSYLASRLILKDRTAESEAGR